MKRMFFITLSVLMALTIIRNLTGVEEPMTLTRFLNTLTVSDFSFENTLEQIAELRVALVFPEMGDTSFFEKVSVFFTWFYNLFKNMLFVPFEILHDALDFLASVLVFFQMLLT